MTEITAQEKPRTFIPRSGHVFYISHASHLQIMHKDCGGCIVIVMHTRPAEAWIPPLKQCKCEVTSGQK